MIRMALVSNHIMANVPIARINGGEGSCSSTNSVSCSTFLCTAATSA